jgi:hypothetical protein
MIKLEAPTSKLALEWHNALAETCLLLAKGPSDRPPAAAPSNAAEATLIATKRRLNIHDSATFEEPPPFTAVSQQGPRRGSLLFSLLAPPESPITPPVPAPTAPKHKQAVEAIMQCLQQHFLLRTLKNLQPIVDRMQPLLAVPGEVIIWYLADHAYLNRHNRI